MFKLQETAIPTNLTQSMETQKFGLEANQVNMVYDTVIKAISDFLGQAKSKEVKTALAIKDAKGNLVVGGIVTYHKPEEDDMPGNWSYELTFNDEDLQGCKVHLSSDPHFERVYDKTVRNLYGFAVEEVLALQPLFEEAFTVLKHWLDINAKDGEEVNVEQPGFFIASVLVENGEKVFSIVPDGAMKRLIKDDSAIEA